MKVAVQVINTTTNLISSGVIEEPVKKGFEIDNALKHFSVSYAEINWDENLKKSSYDNTTIMVGNIPETSKIITVITYGK